MPQLTEALLVECLFYYWLQKQEAVCHGRERPPPQTASIREWCRAPKNRQGVSLPPIDFQPPSGFPIMVAAREGQSNGRIDIWADGPHNNSPVWYSLSSSECACAAQAAQAHSQKEGWRPK